MKNMENMEKDDIMKRDDIMRSTLLDTANLYVGIDLHKEYYTGTIMDENGDILAWKNFAPTLAEAQTFFQGIPPSRTKVAIEACGLWRGAYKLFIGLGYDVVLADPVKTHAIVGKKKTDSVDSRNLADLLRIRYLPEVYVPQEDIFLLRYAARHSADLTRIRQTLQCKIKSFLDREGIAYRNS